MDPQQTAALNALAPYLALSSSANSSAAASTCIAQAISSPNTYVFAELLSKPSIQALRDAEPQHARWLRTLEIFSWGIWNDYQTTKGLPELSEVQATKLRLLTIVTLAQSSPQNLTYDALLSSLGIADVTMLQALLTQGIYAGVFAAKLNPRKQRVDLVSVAPLRDLAPGSIPTLLQILTNWETQCAAVYKEIEDKVASVTDIATQRNDKEYARKTELDDALIKAERGSKRDGDGLGDIRDQNKRGGHHGFLAGRTKHG